MKLKIVVEGVLSRRIGNLEEWSILISDFKVVVVCNEYKFKFSF